MVTFCAFLMLTEILVYSDSKFTNCMINGGEKIKIKKFYELQQMWMGVVLVGDWLEVCVH